MSHHLPRPEHCLNCGEPAVGTFCPRCGQKNEDRTVSFRLLAADVIEDVFNLDSKVFRTVAMLVSRPGFLTREYVSGRRAAYLSPFRVYLAMSVIFFVALFWRVSITGGDAPNVLPIVLEPPPPPEMEVQEIKLPAEAGGETIQVPKVKDPEGYKQLMRRFSKAQRGSMPTIALGPFKLDLGDLADTLEEYDAAQAAAGEEDRHSPLQQALTRRAISIRNDPREFVRNLQQNVPKMMFLLLPFFALLLELLYLRQGRLYVEHLTFSLHGHAFVFLTFTLSALIDVDWVSRILMAASAIYLLWSMRVVYRQSWPVTVVKSGILAFTYAMLVSVGLLATVFLTVWLA